MSERHERGINPEFATRGVDAVEVGGRPYATETVRQVLMRRRAIDDAARLALQRVLQSPGYVAGIEVAAHQGAALATRVAHADTRPLDDVVRDAAFDWGPVKPLHVQAESSHAEPEPESHEFAPATCRPKAVLPSIVVGVPHGYKGSSRELEPDTAVAYEALLASAREAGFAEPLFTLASDYRSDEEQQVIWDAARRNHPNETEAETATWVAPPGHSNHRSGKAIDFWLGLKLKRFNVGAMRATPAYAWLKANAARFGFNEYHREPWHWEHNANAADCLNSSHHRR